MYRMTRCLLLPPFHRFGLVTLTLLLGASGARAQKPTVQPIAPAAPSPQAPAKPATSFVISLPADRLIYDTVSRKIYATVGSKGQGQTTNSITVIDPLTGAVGPSVFVGSGPGAITLSEGSKCLFVSVSDGTAVRRVDLPGLTAGPLYPMPDKTVRALLPAPGHPDGFIALRGNDGRYEYDLGIYVDGKLVGTDSRCGPQVVPGIAPTRLFTYQNLISSWDFDGYDVSPDGISHISHNQSLMSGNVGLAGSLNGLVITDGGGVIDPETRQNVGRLNFDNKRGAVVPDPRTGYVFCITEERNGQAIIASDTRNFGLVGTLPFNLGVSGEAKNALRWGEDGFAYTVGERVIIFRMAPGPLLPPNDLMVERSEIPKTLPRDNKLTYQLTVTNQGAAPATGVFLSDALPPAVDVLTMKTSQGSVTSADNTVRSEIGTLAPGAKAIVDVALQFKEVRDVNFAAVVRARESDPRPENNIARYMPSDSLSPLPDLTGQWDELRQVSRGAGINLEAGVVGRFTVRNDGKQASRPVSLRFYVSPGPRFDAKYSLLIQEVSIPALRAKQTYGAALQARLDRTDDVTGLTLFAVIDADATLNESNRSNNNVGQRVP